MEESARSTSGEMTDPLVRLHRAPAAGESSSKTEGARIAAPTRARRAVTWLAGHKLELSIFLFGALLRMSMAWNYAPNWSYDSDLHWEVVTWVAKHGKVPYPETTFEAFHPPLYYALAAGLTKLGVTRAGMAWFSIIPSIFELGVIWAGLELYVTHSRVARVSALALAAGSAALVHLGGMVYSESLNCFLNALVMLVVPFVFRRRGSDRWPLALFIGLVLGLGMLTKISTAATVLAVGMGVALELLFSRRRVADRARDALPWVGTLVVCIAISGWYFARNVREYGKPFVTSFDLSQHWLVEKAEQKQVLDRRTLGFLFGWDTSLYVHPFSIQRAGAHARLIPVGIASTFIDFWGYGYQGFDHPLPRKKRQMRPQSDTLEFARAAMVGGTVIFAATVLGWLASLRRTWGFRDFGRLTLVLVPLAMLIATLQFTTVNPVDSYGVVKGIYMSFGAPPLYGAFGVATGWAARTRNRLPLFLLLVAAMLSAIVYSVDCRLWPL